MCSGLATYSPASVVVVVKVCPRSTSLTVILAPVTTAPLGSFTVPTMLPGSFWAAATPLRKLRRIGRNKRRRLRTVGISGSFTAGSESNGLVGKTIPDFVDSQDERHCF